MPYKVKILTKKEVQKWIEIETNDANFPLKHKLSKRQLLNSLYKKLVRDMYDEETFLHHEKNEFGVDCYIRGYVRDVWEFLNVNYDILQEYVYTGKYKVPKYNK